MKIIVNIECDIDIDPNNYDLKDQNSANSMIIFDLESDPASFFESLYNNPTFNIEAKNAS